jgi:hypothetical protein
LVDAKTQDIIYINMKFYSFKKKIKL